MPAQNKVPRVPQASKTHSTHTTKKSPLQQQQNGGHNRNPSTTTPAKNAKRSSMNAPSMLPTAAPLDYDKVQRDEVEVLKSIFMDDYEHVETAGAWNKSNIAFKLRLKAPSDEEVSCVLSVTMNATYPKTAPDLRLAEYKSIRTYQLEPLKNIVRESPKRLLGQEMIFEIASSVQDALEEIVQSKLASKEKPSLDEERAQKAMAAQLQARKEEEEVRRKKEREAMEKQRKLEKEIAEELRRQKEHARESHEKHRASSLEYEDLETAEDGVLFDRAIQIKRGVSGSSYIFRKVSGMVKVATGPVMSVYTVRPILPSDQVNDLPLVLKQVDIPDRYTNGRDGKQDIQKLEEELDTLKKLSHPNVVQVYESKVSRTTATEASSSDGWRISVLMEYSNKGSLHDLLETVDVVSVDIARSWTICLLEALDYLHRRNAVHRGIHAGNVLLFRQGIDNSTVPKFTDVGYTQSLLYIINRSGDDTSPLASSTLASPKSAFWFPPELSHDKASRPNRKTDIWNLGVILLQMIFGLNVVQKYNSPSALLESIEISDSLADFLERIFKPDPRKRATAFDLLPSEFLRNDDPIYPPVTPSSPMSSHARLSWSPGARNTSRHRHDSVSGLATGPSRYASDFQQLGTLGKGGFGKVVKARNRLDGRAYAIKKITQKSGVMLNNILHEVILLSRLNHKYVVRYFTAWLEEEDFASGGRKVREEGESEDESEEDSEDDEDSSSQAVSFSESSGKSQAKNSNGVSDAGVEFIASSTGGLDFISSSGYPKVQFGYDSDETDETTSSEEGVANKSGSSSQTKSVPKQNVLKKMASNDSRKRANITLYIQMSLAERQTLRDRIRHGLDTDEGWRLLRQILEGLAHIHDLGIIHRDLKPENIFIDARGDPQIGDFGLATRGQVINKSSSHTNPGAGSEDSVNLTTNVGTALYVAPELKEKEGKYNDRVDMYSLGIIFFEMCHPLKTGMERDAVIRKLREREIEFPSEFWTEKRAVQGSIIKSLLNHNPAERPSSMGLLSSGKLPLKVEDETIQLALQSLSDPGTPYHQQVMSALFSQSTKEYKDHTYDPGKSSLLAHDLLLQSMVKERLRTIFRHHGAVETTRPLLLPRSKLYSRDVVQLLDSSGALVQLPYDLTLPHARSLARQESPSPKTFTFGTVYRENVAGGQPRSHGEVDFDIISYDSFDLALKEAEVVKVIDEIVDAFPSLKSVQMCYHINHADLLDMIMDFCRINPVHKPVAKEILSKLNTGQWQWPRIRNELITSELGILPTSLDDLARFDWRDDPEKASLRMQSLLEGSPLADRVKTVFAHMNAVIGYMKRFGINRKIYVNPLGTWNDKFYRGGIVFQCLVDSKKRNVFAAGGRYDSLIQSHRPKMRGFGEETHAVGFNLGWESLFTSMSRYQRTFTKSQRKKGEEENLGAWATRRCDVLVASFCGTALRTQGTAILQELWANGISAELAGDATSHEQLLSAHRGDGISYIIIIKQGLFVGSSERNLKVKNLFRKEETDVRSMELIPFLKNELAERDRKERSSAPAKLARNSSSNEVLRSGADDVEMDVRILPSDRKGRKISRNAITDRAQRTAQQQVQGFLNNSPIAAVDIRDDLLEEIKATTLSDPESWRKVIQNTPALDRRYMQQVHELVQELAAEGFTSCFIYNYRTGSMVFYYLG